MRDTLADGRPFRVFTVVDDFTRESPVILVDRQLSSERVIAVLEQLAATRGLPPALACDNGAEFTSRAFDAWAYRRGIKLLFIRPGRPVENALIESFNGRLRDECLSASWFLDLGDARAQAAVRPRGPPAAPRDRELHRVAQGSAQHRDALRGARDPLPGPREARHHPPPPQAPPPSPITQALGPVVERRPAASPR